MKKFNKLLLSAIIALSAATMLSSCDVKEGFGGFVDTVKDTVYGWIGIETEEEPETPEDPKTPAEKKCVVTFAPNGGTLAELQKEYTVGAAYTLPTITKKGYTFLGWYNGETRVVETGTWTAETPVTLTAKWQANTYTLTFDVDGGSAIDAVEWTYDQSYDITDKTTTRKGFNFGGWKYNDESFATTGTWTYDSNITIVAVWVAPSVYDVTFNLDGGAFGETIEKVEQAVGEPWSFPTPTKKGYNFTGWVDGDNTPVASNGEAWGYNSAVTLKATWSAKQYTVIFEAIGAVNCPDTLENVTYDAAMPTLGEPTRFGYIFKGWKIKGTDTAVSTEGNWIYDDTDSLFVNPTIVLVPVGWEEKKYTVKFETGNGDEKSDMTCTISDIGDALADGTDSDKDYTFLGWYLNGVKYTGITEELLALADSNGGVITLKAKWSSNWTKNY